VRSEIERRLEGAVGGAALASRLPEAAAPLIDRRGDDPALARISGDALRGLARAVASQPEAAKFLSHRPALLQRIADLGPRTLAERSRTLRDWKPEAEPGDLEGALDALRLLRREETCLAACADLGGLSEFESVSGFLSLLAETITRRALELARHAPRAWDLPLEFTVIGMGKIAGREFTYHSDLDLLFLFENGAERVDDASRVGQRLISYLTTMTAAGIAYAVDTRLRPSGRQGMLVTSLDAFERYQCSEAQTWEHVAMLRARAIAGAAPPAEAALARVRRHLFAHHPPPWPALVEIRRRVEQERGTPATGAVAFKTGAGGLMDVDFLAGGGLLETAPSGFPEIPSVPAMLRAAVQGPKTEALLADYALLRRVEGHVRWMAGRAVEELPTDAEGLSALAELTREGLTGEGLRDEVEAARRRIRAGYQRVISAGTITALER
jgi:glutamate-ammonia-ligase adenylyltransferase